MNVKKNLVIFVSIIIVFGLGIVIFFSVKDNEKMNPSINQNDNMSDKDVINDSDNEIKEETSNNVNNDDDNNELDGTISGEQENQVTNPQVDSDSTTQEEKPTPTPPQEVIPEPVPEPTPDPVPEPTPEPESESEINENEVDVNDMFYSIHQGRVEYPSLSACDKTGAEIALSDTINISYYNCVEVHSVTNKLLGAYLDIVCASGDCNRFKN